MSLVSDVVTHLAAQSLVDDGTWPSSRRFFHDETDKLVVIAEDGGPPPEVSASSGLGSEALGTSGALITVRGSPYKGDAAFTRAKAILDQLHSQHALTIGSNLYRGVRSLTKEPIFAGYDDNNRPMFTVAIRAVSSVAAPA